MQTYYSQLLAYKEELKDLCGVEKANDNGFEKIETLFAQMEEDVAQADLVIYRRPMEDRYLPMAGRNEEPGAEDLSEAEWHELMCAFREEMPIKEDKDQKRKVPDNLVNECIDLFKGLDIHGKAEKTIHDAIALHEKACTEKDKMLIDYSPPSDSRNSMGQFR